MDIENSGEKNKKSAGERGHNALPFKNVFFFLFNTFHSQFVQFGHLVEFFNYCLPYIIESFSNFTDVILTLSCHYRCRVVLTN